MAPGQAEEIRAGLSKFSESGKPVFAHAQGFEGPAIANYFAVTGASSIWLQDTASFSASGYASESTFLGDLIERVGAEAEYLAYYEYKSAASAYTEGGYTEAHREATMSWLGSLFDTAITLMANDRSMERSRMQSLIENAPYSAEQAQERQLVDQLGHAYDARLALAQQIGKRVQYVSFDAYARSAQQTLEGEEKVIALISAQGPISTGSGSSGLSGGDTIGSDRLTALILQAAASPRVGAIIIRVNSPGGSAIASDQIHSAILRARGAGKPVVISMGAVAASGGYYIAAPADRIVAHASTLTGSIGVVTGKLVLDGALDRIGVQIEPLYVGGEFTTSFSSSSTWTPTQRAAFEQLTNDVYVDFTQRVADGRDLPLSVVQDIARGRVWTGAQALELGLVDRLGGLNEALDEARQLSGLEDAKLFHLRANTPSNPFIILQQFFTSSASIFEMIARLNALLSAPEIQDILESQYQLGTGPQLHSSETVVVPEAP
jgi:protease-4